MATPCLPLTIPYWTTQSNTIYSQDNTAETCLVWPLLSLQCKMQSTHGKLQLKIQINIYWKNSVLHSIMFLTSKWRSFVLHGKGGSNIIFMSLLCRPSCKRVPLSWTGHPNTFRPLYILYLFKYLTAGFYIYTYHLFIPCCNERLL